MQYAYFYGALFFLLIWLVIFWRRQDLRKQMLVMGILLAPIAFLQDFFVSEYWNPQVLFNLINRAHFSIEYLILLWSGTGV